MRVYHLLSAENALSDIALQRMKIARFVDLNDPFELLSANLGEKEVRHALRGWKKEFNEVRGMLCFSRKWENPVLWSHYGAKHRGICLGFDLKDKLAHLVQYADSRIPVSFKDEDPNKGLSKKFEQDLLCTKYIHWQYEEEVRTFIKLDPSTVEGNLYFYPFSESLVLREVILGPFCEIPIVRIRTLVQKTCQSAIVIKARLAFKWFKVVPHKHYSVQSGVTS